MGKTKENYEPVKTSTQKFARNERVKSSSREREQRY